MLYQLPNGRVIHLSIEEYLSLDDNELKDLAQTEYGVEPSFSTNFTSKTIIIKETFTEDPLDYTPDIDDTCTNGPIDINSLPDS